MKKKIVPSSPSDNILKAFPSTGKVLMMFDYDGTLTPIVSQPEQAQISHEGLALLKQLAANPRNQLGIVSGRSVEQLQHFLTELKDTPMLLGGLHGGQIYDMQSKQFLRKPTSESARAITSLYERVKHLEQKYPGVRLENKQFALALHYRNTEDEATAEKAIGEFKTAIDTEGLLKDFHFKPGKKVLELAPKTCDKGNAVAFMSQLATQKADEPYFPVYFGDDLTDEDAFKAVNQASGLSVRLGDPAPQTAAGHALPDYQTLYQLLGQIQAGSAKAK